MKRNAYPNYKPSGVEWLGEVPGHWGKLSLKWASIRYSGGTPDKKIQEYWEDGTIPWLNSGAVNDEYITEPSEYITKEAFQNSSAKWIPKDALVMALAGQGKTKGMVGQLGFNTTCNQSMAAIIPDKRLNPRMLYWWLIKNYINIRNLAGGEARDGLNLDLLGSIPVPLPSLPEQHAIAAFLDRETGKIDLLITKKQRLLSLLAERRTALISRAVTKGLDANVNMKPSGVEWLGELPEHWEVFSLKIVCDVRDGTHDTPEYVNSDDDSYPLVTSKDLSTGILTFEQTQYISKTDYQVIAMRSGVEHGDILMPMIGTVGGAVLVETEKKFAIKNIALFKNSKKFNNRWLMYHINSEIVMNQFDFAKSGGVQGFVGLGTLRNLTIIYPPLPEQQAIAAYLDRETAKIDALSAKVETIIERLKEYRTALISEAVTGKIDVREAV